eukprot:TRINITY_DN3287_c0_g1_i1.p1 TRINITY_DN3287_c0_g1~~TRINITY_DN3287_c0_g1_i1.p1  ORF type:complete len:223 (+),score=37.78 TRINITY_DN3287_c0_g1_i1:46-714(+)
MEILTRRLFPLHLLSLRGRNCIRFASSRSEGGRNGGTESSKAKTGSSKNWLRRQERDPYVKAAQDGNLRARSAFKLSQIDDSARLLKPGHSVVDLGSSPGGWSLVAADRINANAKTPGKPKGSLISVDLLPMDPIVGCHFIQCDFTKGGQEEIKRILETNSVDVVLSDMAPNTSGIPSLDHIRSVALCEEALEFAKQNLKVGGVFLCKVFQGGQGTCGFVFC